MATTNSSAKATVAKGMKDILAGKATPEQVLDSVNKRCPGVPRLARKPHSHPRTGFNRKAANADGLSRRCKACQAADRAERRQRHSAAKATKPAGGAAKLPRAKAAKAPRKAAAKPRKAAAKPRKAAAKA